MVLRTAMLVDTNDGVCPCGLLLRLVAEERTEKVVTQVHTSTYKNNIRLPDSFRRNRNQITKRRALDLTERFLLRFGHRIVTMGGGIYERNGREKYGRQDILERVFGRNRTGRGHAISRVLSFCLYPKTDIRKCQRMCSQMKKKTRIGVFSYRSVSGFALVRMTFSATVPPR